MSQEPVSDVSDISGIPDEEDFFEVEPERDLAEKSPQQEASNIAAAFVRITLPLAKKIAEWYLINPELASRLMNLAEPSLRIAARTIVATVLPSTVP